MKGQSFHFCSPIELTVYLVKKKMRQYLWHNGMCETCKLLTREGPSYQRSPVKVNLGSCEGGGMGRNDQENRKE